MDGKLDPLGNPFRLIAALLSRGFRHAHKGRARNPVILPWNVIGRTQEARAATFESAGVAGVIPEQEPEAETGPAATAETISVSATTISEPSTSRPEIATRSDVYIFGYVPYGMLTGEAAREGASKTQTGEARTPLGQPVLFEYVIEEEEDEEEVAAGEAGPPRIAGLIEAGEVRSHAFQQFLSGSQH